MPKKKQMPKKLENLGYDIDAALSNKYMEKLKLEGLCCSFAMDFAKKKLAGKVVDPETYKSEARIKKIVKRQALQAKGKDDFDGLKRVASAYGMKINGESVYWGFKDQFGVWTCSGNGFTSAMVYVTLGFKDGDRHGFTIDARTSTVLLADSGSGVYSQTGFSLGQMTHSHLELLDKEKTVESFYCLSLSL